MSRTAVARGCIDALVIEQMIEWAEETLQQLDMDAHHLRIAHSADVALQQLSVLFFSGQQQIDRLLLEHAFNEFVQRIEFYLAQADHDFKLFAYFILLREMMHHLNLQCVDFQLV